MAGNDSKKVFNTLGKYRLVPVISLEDAGHAAPLAQALLDGGLPVAEITFRTSAAEASIRTMADRGDMLVGAGTVLSVEQVHRAHDAGAAFVVAPGLNPKVVQCCLDLGLTVCPGVATPTDIETAMSFGLDVVKFFPAEAYGGINTLKAIAAPYGKIRFMPTGGIGPDNLRNYLQFEKVLACGGSWMVKPSLYEYGDFERVAQLTREAIALTCDERK